LYVGKSSSQHSSIGWRLSHHFAGRQDCIVTDPARWRAGRPRYVALMDWAERRAHFLCKRNHSSREDLLASFFSRFFLSAAAFFRRSSFDTVIAAWRRVAHSFSIGIAADGGRKWLHPKNPRFSVLLVFILAIKFDSNQPDSVIDKSKQKQYRRRSVVKTARNCRLQPACELRGASLFSYGWKQQSSESELLFQSLYCHAPRYPYWPSCLPLVPVVRHSSFACKVIESFFPAWEACSLPVKESRRKLAIPKL
jgi:hypothetical protein